MDSEEQPLLDSEHPTPLTLSPSKKHSSDTVTRWYYYEHMLQGMKTVVSEAFYKVDKFVNLVVTTFMNFDNWRRSACIFYLLTWIVWAIAAMRLPSLIWKLLIVLVFPELLWGLYLLQSAAFLFIAQSEAVQLIAYIGIGILHEIMYPKLKGHPLLMFAFAFQQAGLILQYRFYYGINHRLIPVDFQQRGPLMLQMLVSNLMQTMCRSYFHDSFVEAAALLVPVLVGFCVTWEFVNWQSLVKKTQIQSPEGKVSIETQIQSPKGKVSVKTQIQSPEGKVPIELDCPGHEGDKLVEEEETETETEEEEEVEDKAGQCVNWCSVANKIQLCSPEGKVSVELDCAGHEANKLEEEEEEEVEDYVVVQSSKK